MSKIGRYAFQVEPFQEDFMGELSWGTLGNLLLRCANFHASERGFGRLLIDGQLHVWVLSRMVIEMERMPRTGGHFAIETWVRSAYRFFTDRCFAITDEAGRPLGYAYTIWALINMNTRESVPMSSITNEAFLDCIDAEKPCPVTPPGRIRLKAAVPARTIDTYYSDIDVNNHVNSIRYIEHVLDLFPKERYAAERVARIEVAYSEEAFAGEPLTFYREAYATAQKENVEVRKPLAEGDQSTVVLRARVDFAERKTENV